MLKRRKRFFSPLSNCMANLPFSVTGTGLAICQRIVARHHGVMKVCNSGESASTFKMTLPIKQGSE
jgi:light-regulated signal transduction histidine kinase (bacteriophytochrome)